MAYKKEDLYKQAIEAAKDNKKKPIFIEHLVAELPCSKPTFYEYFPVDSNEFNAIKEIIERNRVTIKSSMLRKWYNSNNATLQIGLMKLIATEEEAHRLNGSRQETKLSGEVTTHVEVTKPVSIIVNGLPKSLEEVSHE